MLGSCAKRFYGNELIFGIMCNLTCDVHVTILDPLNCITRAFLTLRSTLDLVIQLNGWPVVNCNQLWLSQQFCVLQHVLKCTSIFIILLKYFALFSSCLPVPAIWKADVSLSKYLSKFFQLSTFWIQMDSRFHIFLLYKDLNFSFKSQNKEVKLAL